MKNLTLLGSTGSIGRNTLDVIRRHAEKYRVFALVAGQNVELLVAQILEFHPPVAVVATEEALGNLITKLQQAGLPRAEWPELGWGAQPRMDAARAPEVDFVMSAIVGVAGLPATYQAARLGKTIGLATKEVLVVSGRLVMEAARAARRRIDSGGQRTQRSASVPAGGQTQRGGADHSDGFRGPVSGNPGREAGRRDPG